LGWSGLPSDRPLAGLGALGGAGLIATVQLLIGWGLWRVLMWRLQGRRQGLSPWTPRWIQRWMPRWSRHVVMLAALVLSAHLLGAAALGPAQELSESAGQRETVLVIQPAIPTREKFEPAQQRRLLQNLAQTLERLSAGGAATALAANRTALPVSLASVGLESVDFELFSLEALRPGDPKTNGPDRTPPRTAAIDAVLLPEGALALDQPLPVPAPVEVLSGGFRRQGEGLRSALLRFEPGERWPGGGVDKHRLVPLGEWVPLSGLVRWSGLSAVGGLEPGAAPRLVDRPRGRIGVAICYELADGHGLVQASRDGAQWLLASANLDPYPILLQQQYAAVAQLRSIETGRWLVSAANTGPSLMVDPAGRLRGHLTPLIPGQALAELRHVDQLSPYGRLGELPLLVTLLLAAASRGRALSPQGLFVHFRIDSGGSDH
jgi:apolipoprotein N-acyltransferase